MLNIKRLDARSVAEVMLEGKAVQSSSFLLKMVNNGSTKGLFAGFIASKKIFKSAVERNKAKRRMRAVLQQLIKKQTAKESYKIAFLMRKEVLTKEYKQLVEEVERILQKSAILS